MREAEVEGLFFDISVFWDALNVGFIQVFLFVPGVTQGNKDVSPISYFSIFTKELGGRVSPKSTLVTPVVESVSSNY